MLRNLKLEPPPTADDNSQLGTTSPPAALVVKSTAEQRNALLQNEAAARRQEELESSKPASLARLGSRDGASDTEEESAGPSSATASARSKKAPSQKKYTWFSLYEDQGVGGRRNSIRSGDTGQGLSASSGGIVGVSDMGVGADNVSSGGRISRSGSGSSSGKQQSARSRGQDSSSKGEYSWRWGWGRKRSGSVGEGEATAAVAAAAALPNGSGSERVKAGGTRHESGKGGGKSSDGVKGGDKGQALVAGFGSEPAVPSKAPRKRMAEIEQERRRLRRKDVYSYFIMPLVRALEAQMGTTAWLRKVRCLRLVYSVCFCDNRLTYVSVIRVVRALPVRTDWPLALL